MYDIKESGARIKGLRLKKGKRLVLGCTQNISRIPLLDRILED